MESHEQVTVMKIYLDARLEEIVALKAEVVRLRVELAQAKLRAGEFVNEKF
jgi:hypothetical protein